MSPRPAVHYSKKEAILQLCNFLSPNSCCNITDLADGEILQKAIASNFPNENALFDCPDISNLEKEDKDFSDKLNCVETVNSNEDINDIELNNPENVSVTQVTLNESHPAKDILLKFNYIQKFIDDHYQIDSKDIIDYNKCPKSSELELTKVAIFILCEIVNYLIKINNEDLKTLFHLELRYQVELEECFQLFISAREKINKRAVEELLCKKATSTTASPLITPRRTSLRRCDKKSIPPPTLSEDVFNYSPLKSFFESPVFKKEDIYMKEREISNLKKTLEFGEEESLKLHSKVIEMQEEIKVKDKALKEFQKQMAEMKEDIQSLQNSCQSEICKAEKDRLLTEINMSKSNAAFVTNRVIDLNAEIAELHRLLEEKNSIDELKRLERMESSPLNENKILMTASKKIKAYEEDIAVLRESVRSLELKNHTYRKQISEYILTDIKEKNSPGNLNRSYEEKWEELDRERKEREENIGRLIEADYKNLWSKLTEANLKNKKLLDEMEILKKQLHKKNKLSDHRKEVCSVDKMPELIDTSIEEERLRNSLNHSKCIEHCHLSDEPSFILNNSDNPTSCRHPIFCPESGVFPCPEKSSEAVLWKMYNSEQSDTENSCDINLDLNADESENSDLDLINDLGINNEKKDNAEADALLSHENNYVLGNLNFNVFLNELKKLTRNGSFQKVLQVFGKCQKELNGTNKSNALDLQEMLKMITDCMCVAVTSNAESSFANLKDNWCMTEEISFYDKNHNSELDQLLKRELSAVSQEHEIKLMEHEKELEELKRENSSLEIKYQACKRKLSEKIQDIENVLDDNSKLKINFDAIAQKYQEIKELNRKHMDARKKIGHEFQQLKYRAQCLKKKKDLADISVKKLKNENDDLKNNVHRLEEKIKEIKALQEKERKDLNFLPPADYSIEMPNQVYVKSEFQCSILQDTTTNDSMLSSAFHKNLSHYECENEEDYFNFNSLDVIKKEDSLNREEELKRRNSLLPLHLQSAYPIEANLHAAYENFYVKGSELCLEENCSKKRKLDDVILEEPLYSIIDTPVTKNKRRGTPKSLKRFMKNIKRHSFAMKPKGS